MVIEERYLRLYRHEASEAPVVRKVELSLGRACHVEFWLSRKISMGGGGAVEFEMLAFVGGRAR
jgi:hypothetical protein